MTTRFEICRLYRAHNHYDYEGKAIFEVVGRSAAYLTLRPLDGSAEIRRWIRNVDGNESAKIKGNGLSQLRIAAACPMIVRIRPTSLADRMFHYSRTAAGLPIVIFDEAHEPDAKAWGGHRITDKWRSPSPRALRWTLDTLRREVDDHTDELGRFDHAGLTAELEVTEDAVKLRGIEIDYGTAVRRNCWPAYFEAWAQLNEREMENA